MNEEVLNSSYSNSKLQEVSCQLMEAWPFKWLGEDVSNLMLSGDILELYVPLQGALSDVEVAYIYVLALLVAGGTLGEVDAALVVLHDGGGAFLGEAQLSQEGSEAHGFPCCFICTYYLCSAVELVTRHRRIELQLMREKLKKVGMARRRIKLL